MGLTDKIEGAIEDFKKRNNEPEVWEILKKKLKKRGFDYEGSYYSYKDLVIEGISSVGADRFLKVWDAINQYLNKNNYKWDASGEHEKIKKSFGVMKTLSEIDDVEGIIKVLAETGYELPTYYGQVSLPEESLNLFNALAKDGLYKKYDSVFKVLNKFGYKKVNNYKNMNIQVNHIISLACLEGDAVGAIYVLANNGYKIDEAGGLAKLYIRSIKKITEEDEKERSEGKGGIPIYLYNTGNLEIFQEYFNGLEIENKKSVLRSILDYEAQEEPQEQNNQIRDWIEKDYESLIREVGFEDAV